MRFVNLTPHPVTLIGAPEQGHTTIQPDPRPARVKSTPGPLLMVCLEGGGVELWGAPEWGEVEGMLEPQDDTIYIVSGPVAERCAGRKDVFQPGTGPNDGCQRDESGRIIGVTRLIRAPSPSPTRRGC
jgi:hypothetical protein